MKKMFWRIALAFLFAALPARAQNITAASATCAGTGACVSQAVTDQDGGSSVGLSGTFSATLQFEATNSPNPTTDSAAVWTSIQLTPSGSSTAATSATAPGLWQGNVAGYTGIRVRCSAYTSGAVTVVIHISPVSARANGGGGAGGAVSSVTAADTSLTISPTTGAVVAALNQANAFNFTAAGAASTPAFTLSGSPFVGTGTTSTPQIYENNSVTAPTTWNSSASGGTYFGWNAESGFAGNFLDAHVNGGVSVFSVSSNGGITGSALVAPTVNASTSVSANAYVNRGTNHILISATAPVIGTCGTSPSIVANNGTAAFTVNVGTGGTATTCTVTMPAATTGWGCSVSPNGAPQAAAETFAAPTSTTLITISNYTASTAAALAFAASAVFNVECTGY